MEPFNKLLNMWKKLKNRRAKDESATGFFLWVFLIKEHKHRRCTVGRANNHRKTNAVIYQLDVMLEEKKKIAVGMAEGSADYHRCCQV